MGEGAYRLMFDWLFRSDNVEFELEGKTLVRLVDGIQAVVYVHVLEFEEKFNEALYWQQPIRIYKPDESGNERWFNPNQIIYFEAITDEEYEAMKYGPSQEEEEQAAR